MKYLFFIFLVFSTSLFSQGNDYRLISQYVQQKWTTDNGLPHNSITAIAQTKDGYIWFGSPIGLIKFNGINFTLLNHKNHPEVKLTDIWCLAADDSNNLWIGSSSNGLIEYSKGKFNAFSTKDGLADNSVWSLFVENGSTIWVGTGGGGVSILQNGKFKTINENDGLSSNYIWSFSKDFNGNIWIGTDGSYVNEYSKGRITVFNPKKNFPGDYTMASLTDSEGNLWFGAAGIGIIKYTQGKFKVFGERDGLINNVIWSIKEDLKGNIWIGTDGGLMKFSNNKFDSYTEADGLSNNSVKAVYTDKEGNIWIGTNGGGVTKFRDGPFCTYSKEEGLTNNHVSAIYQDNSGDIWFGTGKGLTRLRNNKFTSYYRTEGLNGDNILSVHGDHKGNIWIGTDGLGLYCLSNGKFKRYSFEDGLLSNAVWSIMEDKEGTMWFGTDGKGISKFKNGGFTDLSMEQGLSGEFITALLQDHNGVIWVGTRDSSGLDRIENDNIKIYKTKDGLLSNNIYSLFEDKKNNLWIGTDAGLNKIKNGRMFRYSKENGLPSDLIYSINEDDLGKIWISSSDGVFNIEQKEFEKYDDGLTRKIHTTYFNYFDGMKSSECSPGSPPSFKTKEGNLWFPTIEGAVVVNPFKIDTNRVIPNVIIDSIVCNKKTYTAEKFEDIPPGSDFIEFYFSALSFSVPQRVLFKYKLEGYDTSWISDGSNHSAKYANIKPGKYKFRVIACNNDGLWNTKGASFEFKLEPHYYQTYWFYTLCLGSLYFFVVSLIKIRTKQLKKREKYLASKIEERSAELIEENKYRKKAEEEAKQSLVEKEKLLFEKTNLLEEKEVLLKEIHHRVKNNLQVVSSLLYLNSKKIKDKEAFNLFKDSQNRVKSIALVHERLYRSQDLNRIDFNGYIKQLIKDLFISYAADKASIRLDLDIKDIFIDVELAVPCGLIINELISNSLKYAFSGYDNKEQSPTISISFNRTDPNNLLLVVSDNGKGIPKRDGAVKSDSLGLTLVETLVSQIEGNMEIKNSHGTSFKIVIKAPLITSNL